MTHPDLKAQIEAAYDYRGHVTVILKSGETVKGFLYNRQLEVPEPFVELFLEGSGEHRKLLVSELGSLALTGKDFAAGNSYEDYLKKKAEKEKEGK